MSESRSSGSNTEHANASTSGSLIQSTEEESLARNFQTHVNERSLRQSVGGVTDSFKEENMHEPSSEVNPRMKKLTRFYLDELALEKGDYKRDPILHSSAKEADDGKMISTQDLVKAISDIKQRVTAVVGQAGSGKTTLMKRLVRDLIISNNLTKSQTPGGTFVKYFTDQELKFEFIHFLNIKDLDVGDRRVTPKELLFSGHLEQSNEKEIQCGYEWLKENQAKVLFVFDGLDQTKCTLPTTFEKMSHSTEAGVEVVLANILCGHLFKDAQILLSSREHSVASLTTKLRPNVVVAMMGLALQDIEMVFNELVKSKDDDGNANFKTLPPAIVPLCSIPLFLIYCAIIYKKYPAYRPSTMTAVVIQIFKIFIRSDHAYEEDIPRIIAIFAKIAFDGHIQKRVSFTLAELEKCGLTRKMIKVGFMIKVPGSSVLSQNLFDGDYRIFFSHQTLQEILAAMYVCMREVDDFRSFACNELVQPHWSVVRRFVCGLLSNPECQHFDIFRINRKSEKWMILKETLQNMANSYSSKRVELLSLLYESQDIDLIEAIVTEVDFDHEYFTPAGIHAISSIIRCCKLLTLLRLYRCSINRELAEVLERVTRNSNLKVRVLDVSGNFELRENGGLFFIGSTVANLKAEEVLMQLCELDGNDLKYFMKGACGVKFKVLDVSANETLGPDGMYVLGELVKTHDITELAARDLKAQENHVANLVNGLRDAVVDSLDLSDRIHHPHYNRSLLNLLHHVRNKLYLYGWEINAIQKNELEHKLQEIASPSLYVILDPTGSSISLKGFTVDATPEIASDLAAHMTKVTLAKRLVEGLHNFDRSFSEIAADLAAPVTKVTLAKKVEGLHNFAKSLVDGRNINDAFFHCIRFSGGALSSYDIEALGSIVNHSGNLKMINLNNCKLKSGSLRLLNDRVKTPGKIEKLIVTGNPQISVDDLINGTSLCARTGASFIYDGTHLSAKEHQKLKRHAKGLQPEGNGKLEKISKKRKYLTREEKFQRIYKQKSADERKSQQLVIHFESEVQGPSTMKHENYSARGLDSPRRPLSASVTDSNKGQSDRHERFSDAMEGHGNQRLLESATGSGATESNKERSSTVTTSGSDRPDPFSDEMGSQGHQEKEENKKKNPRQKFVPRNLDELMKYKPLMKFEKVMNSQEKITSDPNMTRSANVRNLKILARNSDSKRFEALAFKKIGKNLKDYVSSTQREAFLTTGKSSIKDSGYKSSFNDILSSKGDLRKFPQTTGMECDSSASIESTKARSLKKIEEVQTSDDAYGSNNSGISSTDPQRLEHEYDPRRVAEQNYEMTIMGLGMMTNRRDKIQKWLESAEFDNLPQMQYEAGVSTTEDITKFLSKLNIEESETEEFDDAQNDSYSDGQEAEIVSKSFSATTEKQLSCVKGGEILLRDCKIKVPANGLEDDYLAKVTIESGNTLDRPENIIPISPAIESNLKVKPGFEMEVELPTFCSADEPVEVLLFSRTNKSKKWIVEKKMLLGRERRLCFKTSRFSRWVFGILRGMYLSSVAHLLKFRLTPHLYFLCNDGLFHSYVCVDHELEDKNLRESYLGIEYKDCLKKPERRILKIGDQLEMKLTCPNPEFQEVLGFINWTTTVTLNEELIDNIYVREDIDLDCDYDHAHEKAYNGPRKMHCFVGKNGTEFKKMIFTLPRPKTDETSPGPSGQSQPYVHVASMTAQGDVFVAGQGHCVDKRQGLENSRKNMPT